MKLFIILCKKTMIDYISSSKLRLEASRSQKRALSPQMHQHPWIISLHMPFRIRGRWSRRKRLHRCQWMWLRYADV